MSICLSWWYAHDRKKVEKLMVLTTIIQDTRVDQYYWFKKHLPMPLSTIQSIVYYIILIKLLHHSVKTKYFSALCVEPELSLALPYESDWAIHIVFFMEAQIQLPRLFIIIVWCAKCISLPFCNYQLSWSWINLWSIMCYWFDFHWLLSYSWS